MARFHYTIRGVIEAPEGSKLEGGAIMLPDGSTLKPWETFEHTGPSGDEPTDLDLDGVQELGCFFDGDSAEIEEVDDTSDQLWPPA